MSLVEFEEETQFHALVQAIPQQYDKRAFDIVVCLLILPFLILPMVLIALLIVLDSPGTPWFIQERIGKGGTRFRLYKFRSMSSDHDSTSDVAFMQAYIAGNVPYDEQEPERAFFKPPNQDKITRIGKVLRKTSLDELPQIINILRGEMSLVGPRPNVPWEVDQYRDWHYERLKVLPGITGLAQVNGRSNIVFDDIASYDIQYVRNQSLAFDMWIIWLTVRSVLARDGAN